MANTPKMKDPTEAALSAIQDALNVRDAEPSGTMIAPAAMTADESERAWPGLRSGKTAKTDHTVHFEDEVRRQEDTDPLRRPANDDRESIGQILRSLQRAPRQRPTFWPPYSPSSGSVGLPWTGLIKRIFGRRLAPADWLRPC